MHNETKHALKECERCGTHFECKAGSITLCHCYHIQLTVEERCYLGNKYTDCLCATCLIQMKIEAANALNE